MVCVDDVDEHFRVALANGAEIVSEAADQYWGDRRYEARNLEGHLWFFHERPRTCRAKRSKLWRRRSVS